ncbi:MAG: phytoene/squalene synthase family protein [Candidatus Latescibacterota bacterium]|nr:MAG: phytoene/squalene synthase family protein [Candidatus Latescibacterota bacterium]
MIDDAIRSCYRTIEIHSKSFAFASRLLPSPVRDRAVVVYAWCRRADDAIDLAGEEGARSALERLRIELSDVYEGRSLKDPTLTLFQEVVHDCRIHRSYPEDLLAGMGMDVEHAHYDTMESLLGYCYRVAGTVGLMMCHVMGVSDERATRNAAHMGIAMQLTNICRDVLEDWHRGRLYIPGSVLADFGCIDLFSRLGTPFPESAGVPVARAIDLLLNEADRYYSSGDAGLRALSWRCALSIRTARRVYSAIGARIRDRGCDPLAGRAVVPSRKKLELMLTGLVVSLLELPWLFGVRLSSSARVTPPRRLVSFPDDVLPV